MNKEDRIRTFLWFVKGVLNTKNKYKISNDVCIETIEEEIKEIESMKDEM